jgi:hypothetical protein
MHGLKREWDQGHKMVLPYFVEKFHPLCLVHNSLFVGETIERMLAVIASHSTHANSTVM